jgi:hypothetical protein
VAGGLTYKVTIPYATNQSHTDKDLVVVPNESHTTIKTIAPGSSSMSTTLDTDSLSTSGTSATLVDGTSFTITTQAEDTTYSVTYTVNVTVADPIEYTVTSTSGKLTTVNTSTANATGILKETDTLGGANIALGAADNGKTWNIKSIKLGNTTISSAMYSIADATGLITFTGVAATTVVDDNVVIDAEQVAKTVTFAVTVTDNTGTEQLTIDSATVNGETFTVPVGSSHVYNFVIPEGSVLVLTVTPATAGDTVSSSGATKGTVTANLDGTSTIEYSAINSSTSDTIGATTVP